MTESESVALPLGDAAIIHNAYYITRECICQYVFLIFFVFYKKSMHLVGATIGRPLQKLLDFSSKYAIIKEP